MKNLFVPLLVAFTLIGVTHVSGCSVPNCDNCTTDQLNICDNCSVGFGGDGSAVCITCSIPNCDDCTTDPTSICDKCSSGYYLNETSQCSKCS